MSLPTETPLSRPALKRVPQRPRYAGLLGVVALVGAAGFLGLFIWQAGVLAPPAPQTIKTDDVVAKPDQITAQKASISGRDKSNRPYEIKALSGEQDQAVETLVHMKTITSVFERSNGQKLDVTSENGQFDNKTKTLELSGNVVFSEGERFRAEMAKAEINTEEQSLASKSPVKVDMQGTLIEAGSLTVTDGGTRIHFKGGVKAKFLKKTNATGDGG